MADYCAICDPNGSTEVKYHTPEGETGWLWVDDSTMVLHDEEGYRITGIIPVWFCPYCGRKLLEES